MPEFLPPIDGQNAPSSGAATLVPFLASDGLTFEFETGFAYIAGTGLFIPSGEALDLGDVTVTATAGAGGGGVITFAGATEDFFFNLDLGSNRMTTGSTTGIITIDWDGISTHLVDFRFQHAGDADTGWEFTTDAWTLDCGGVEFIHCLEDGTQDIMTFNRGDADVDHEFHWTGGTAFSIRGSTGTATFHQNLLITGDVGFYNGPAGAQSAAYTLNTPVTQSRTLLTSASATALNNNQVLAAVITDLQRTSLFA